MTNMPSLKTLNLQDDKTITSYPPTLSFPNITTITLTDLPLKISWQTDGIYFKSNSNSSGQKDKCIQDTKNCYGNGQCVDNNGVCGDQGYDPADNCRTKFAPIKPNINNTSPTASFDMDGIDFELEMVSIQELDLEQAVLKEIATLEWTSTIIEKTTTLTNVYYQLDTTTSLINSPPLVTANISFSTIARSIAFGLQQLTINPNSIKLAVNISSWTFESNLSYLRVVFKTKINNKQSYTFDCEEHSIDALSFD
ncbi:hypothetical protein DFA_10756 [Cavenderia fasciculata]|uniref:EGF-like domain-containing protein n=1 Tax=Cavenderia fasciculata TaxID=261658 RepID=F4QBB1_CACFS|nr:uncharacterized protein DFA_10756 [Cavenderia fasciculata]EGG14883.1 hypothetical protein DFA_10756 [Cavenderia fasciculata]|eukprot:XP_004351399.1 hypothetical protein DFA_10756 [Cavenderia fasciculata]